MIAFILCTLIIALTPSQSLRSFSFPIQLNLKRLAASNFSMEVTRTSPHLFRRTLELPTDSDIPFKFDILKWRSLQSSGLFANLTAQLYMANESVALSISGVELPSIFVSPQLSFSPSLSNPEFTGGVSVVTTVKHLLFNPLVPGCL